MHLTQLKDIYYATFSSNLFYGSQIWAQSSKTILYKISVLQRKAIRIMTFSDFQDHSEPLFKKLNILKAEDNIFLLNCLFVHDYFNGNLPHSFDNVFRKVNESYPILTRSADRGCLAINTSNSI